MTIPFLTLTGVDENTSISRIKELASDGVEFAILLTADPEGRNRYPQLDFIKYAINKLDGNCAVHVCGKRARELVMNDLSLNSWLGTVRRIQFNGACTEQDVDRWLTEFPTTAIITQHSAKNPSPRVDDIRHHILVDGSRGRGLTPLKWEAPVIGTLKYVGYAGGLGLDNLHIHLPKIEDAANGKAFWIDMESSLRTNDWFDAAVAEAVITALTIWRAKANDDALVESFADLIQYEVGYFNGWSVSQDAERAACVRAAKCIALRQLGIQAQRMYKK